MWYSEKCLIQYYIITACTFIHGIINWCALYKHDIISFMCFVKAWHHQFMCSWLTSSFCVHQSVVSSAEYFIIRFHLNPKHSHSKTGHVHSKPIVIFKTKLYSTKYNNMYIHTKLNSKSILKIYLTMAGKKVHYIVSVLTLLFKNPLF